MNALAELPQVAFSIADEAIDELRAEYMPLTIRGLDDKEGYLAVREARLVCKRKRVDIEKKRKELKADALEYGRNVDSEAKRLVALLEPVETHLQDEEDAYNAEKERLAQEAEERRRAKLLERMKALMAVQVYHLLSDDVGKLSDAEFEAVVSENRRALEERQAREAAEAAEKAKREAAEAEARRVEAEKLAAERAALEAERKRQAEAEAKLRAEQEKVEADKRRLAAEESARQRQVELEAARKEAAEAARLEAEEEAARKELAARHKAAAEESERKRLESLQPDSDKLLGVAKAVRKIVIPEVSREAFEASQAASLALSGAAYRIEKIASGLVGKE